MKVLCNQQLVISVLLLPGHGKRSTSTDKKKKKNTHSDSRHLIVSATQSDQDLTGTFKPVETKKKYRGFKRVECNFNASLKHTAGNSFVVVSLGTFGTQTRCF